MPELTSSDIIAIISIFVAIGTFLLGFYLGKRDTKKMIGIIGKAFNIERQIKDMKNPELFEEDGTIKGKGTESIQIYADIVDVKNKKISTKDGSRDMTEEEIEKYGEKSPV